jgi:hypothetical protein
MYLSASDQLNKDRASGMEKRNMRVFTNIPPSIAPLKCCSATQHGTTNVNDRGEVIVESRNVDRICPQTPIKGLKWFRSFSWPLWRAIADVPPDSKGLYVEDVPRIIRQGPISTLRTTFPESKYQKLESCWERTTHQDPAEPSGSSTFSTEIRLKSQVDE